MKKFMLLASITLSLQAKNFGLGGQTFEIKENDVQKALEDQLWQSDADKRIQEAKESIIYSAQHPLPAVGIETCIERETHYIDPTHEAKENIHDEKGQLIIAKGTRVNPLKRVQLSSGFLFIDGTQEGHIQWARKQGNFFKWILVRGNPIALEETEGIPIYFDQMGVYTKMFKITHIPAYVVQENFLLKVTEVPINEKGEEL